MDRYLGVARDDGLTNDEIGGAQAIAMAAPAGRVRAQFWEVRTHEAETKKVKRRCRLSAGLPHARLRLAALRVGTCRCLRQPARRYPKRSWSGGNASARGGMVSKPGREIQFI